MTKSIVPILSLSSEEFQKKVLMSLRECNYVNVETCCFIDPSLDKEGDRFLFVLGNAKCSKRKLCLACNGYHHIFCRELEISAKEDESCLCIPCGHLLSMMSRLEVDKDKVVAWMQSRGSINPIDILQDKLEQMIQEKKISFTKEEMKF